MSRESNKSNKKESVQVASDYKFKINEQQFDQDVRSMMIRALEDRIASINFEKIIEKQINKCIKNIEVKNAVVKDVYVDNAIVRNVPVTNAVVTDKNVEHVEIKYKEVEVDKPKFIEKEFIVEKPIIKKVDYRIDKPFFVDKPVEVERIVHKDVEVINPMLKDEIIKVKKLVLQNGKVIQ